MSTGIARTKERSMNFLSTVRTVGVSVVCVAALLLFPTRGFGQGELIGQRGGQTTPTLPSAPAIGSTAPVLPSNLNLPPVVQNNLLNGLNSSGTALRPGMGWLVSQMTHEGIHGQQLADIIHQLKPYKQRGVLTFPQNGLGGTQSPTQSFPTEHGRNMPNFGRGFGKGKR
jgi:hypothetical protein